MNAGPARMPRSIAATPAASTCFTLPPPPRSPRAPSTGWPSRAPRRRDGSRPARPRAQSSSVGIPRATVGAAERADRDHLVDPEVGRLARDRGVVSPRPPSPSSAMSPSTATVRRPAAADDQVAQSRAHRDRVRVVAVGDQDAAARAAAAARRASARSRRRLRAREQRLVDVDAQRVARRDGGGEIHAVVALVEAHWHGQGSTAVDDLRPARRRSRPARTSAPSASPKVTVRPRAAGQVAARAAARRTARRRPRRARARGSRPWLRRPPRRCPSARGAPGRPT